ncbi:hypothetical protein PIB30_029604 [Stylosanthes scabra]|nr:hypothetical protein [Stylosanthes scabra]
MLRGCLKEGSLNVGIDAIEVGEIDGVEVGENHVVEGPNVVVQDANVNVSRNLTKMMEMEFDSSKTADANVNVSRNLTKMMEMEFDSPRTAPGSMTYLDLGKDSTERRTTINQLTYAVYFLETILDDRRFFEHSYTKKPIVSKFEFLEEDPPQQESES